MLILFLVLTLVVIGAVVIGWERYRTPANSSPGLQPTTEVLVDPETGKRQRVWYDAKTGKREYRDEPPPPEGLTGRP